MRTTKKRVIGYWSFCLLLSALLLAACSSGTSTPASRTIQKPTQAPSPTITETTALGQKDCDPASPIDDSSGIPEVQGTATHAQLWALLMSTTGVPPQAKSLVKIVWRMTGSGDFNIVALGPDNMKAQPSQGPILHTGSSWNRPGDEWGSAFTFPVAGCWDLHATRDNASGDVWLQVIK
jgi:hypothetical protein